MDVLKNAFGAFKYFFTDYVKSNLAVLKIDKEHAFLWERMCEIVSC